MIPGLTSAADRPPHVLFVIADDWGPSCRCLPDTVVKTPAFDRVAREGLLFRNAFTPMAKCAPSRAIILTGRYLWQNEEAGNHMAFFPAKLKTWPETLSERGWFTGITGKGWGPGIAKDAEGKLRNMAGKNVYERRKQEAPTKQMSNNDYAANFADFLNDAPADKPWCFWCGTAEPHRGYTFRSGVEQGDKKLADIDRVPVTGPTTKPYDTTCSTMPTKWNTSTAISSDYSMNSNAVTSWMRPS